MGLDVANVFNRQPPYVLTVPGPGYVNYDPTNANPLLRVFSLSVSKKFGDTSNR